MTQSEKIAGHSATELGINRYKYFKERDDKYFWAVDVWWSLKNTDDKYRYAIAMLQLAPEDDLPYLKYLGAGILEDLNGVELLQLLDFIRLENSQQIPSIEKQLCSALRGYRFSNGGIPAVLLKAEKNLIVKIQGYFSDFVPY